MSDSVEYREVDGSMGEGGGEILRNSIAYSAILGFGLKISKIRAGRSKPGLRPQHLQGILLAANLSAAKITGCQENSTEVIFSPSGLKGGRHVADTKTAGSVTLLLQTALPCMLFSQTACEVMLRGGTNTDMAPQIEFVDLVLRPTLEKFDIQFDLDIIRRGYFPRGGGEIRVRTSPIKRISAADLVDPGKIERIYGKCFVAGTLPLSLAEEMKRDVTQFLLDSHLGECDLDIEAVKENSANGNGSGIQLVAKSTNSCLLSGSALGERKVVPSQIARKAVDSLLESTSVPCCVDKYMQDQLVIFMALAPGRSSLLTCALTSHTKTAIDIAQQLTRAKFEVQTRPDGSVLMSCNGVGHCNP